MSNLAHRLKIQNDINTDYIIPAKYKFKTFDSKEFSQHLFEDIENEFCKRIKTGDFLIAGDNFGCGSSKEQAPVALKASGLGAVIAKSYARIFYRNSFNVGFCLVECDTRFIDDMDEVEIDFEKNIVKNMTKGLNIDMKPIPNVMRRILEKGGVIEYFKEKKSFDELA